MSAATRRPVTAEEFVPGTIVYKGNGKTAYRILWVRQDYYGHGPYAAVVKATTVKDPSMASFYPISNYTVEA